MTDTSTRPLAVVLLGWIAVAVPDFAGQGRGRIPLARALRTRGVAPVPAVTFTFGFPWSVLVRTRRAPISGPAVS